MLGVSTRIGIVADDDAYFRMAVGAILTRQLGFSDIIEAGSLDEALERLSEETGISAALFDLSMPGLRTPMNLRSVRECFPQTGLPLFPVRGRGAICFLRLRPACMAICSRV